MKKLIEFITGIKKLKEEVKNLREEKRILRESMANQIKALEDKLIDITRKRMEDVDIKIVYSGEKKNCTSNSSNLPREDFNKRL